MNRVIALVAGLAALTVISTAAEAAQGCGKGYHYNGQRCVPQGGPDHRQPYHKGSSANRRDTGTPPRSEAHPRTATTTGQAKGHAATTTGQATGARPSHRGHRISVDLGPIGRLHFHHGGIHHEKP